MALITEDGTGLANAESYCSVADADTYHAAHGNPSAWSQADEAAKESALRLATQYIDATCRGRWRGVRATLTQRLAWPRRGVTDADGLQVAADELPRALVEATVVLAMKVAGGETLLPDAENAAAVERTRVSVGPVEEDIKYAAGNPPFKRYALADALLRGLLQPAGLMQRG